ncbi:phage protein [Burkholderia gladioli]|uniref:phage protein n=1 Tax=Burkholderia gladioli TaxID=28095 RepID=UPI00163E18A7|nr:hypothetical protein [Burkholderia gladioli]
MTRQYLREAKLLVGPDGGEGLDLSDLRFTFDVRRGDSETPNSARIRVFNLSKDTANRIADEYLRVILYAGYHGTSGVIFDGQLIQARQGRYSQTDTTLDLTCADGDRAYNFSFVNQTLAAGATDADVVAAALRSMGEFGVRGGYIPEITGNAYPRGRVLMGQTREILRCTARDLDMNWSIQDGALTLLPRTSFLPGEIQVVTSRTGMIGLPTQMQNYILVNMLLNPRVRIGSVIELENDSIQRFEFGLGIRDQPQNRFNANSNRLNNASGKYGYYRVMVAEHSGDTRGEDWTTHVICIAVDAVAARDLLGKSTPNFIAPPPGKINPVNPYG